MAMNSNDYSWDAASPLNSQGIPFDVMPNRFALTAPLVVLRQGTGQILLVDPHVTGSWETWMLPYASLILSLEQIRAGQPAASSQPPSALRLGNDTTFDSLACALQELREVFLPEYRAAIAAGVNNVLPQLRAGWSGESFYMNYSLKFSPTSQSYTAYFFDYCISIVAELELVLPHVWIEPGLLRSQLNESNSYNGRPVSSNVLAALPAIVAVVKGKSPH